jgi:hypothetical protein
VVKLGDIVPRYFSTKYIMSIPPPNLANFPYLSQYAILAANGVSTVADTTVYNGFVSSYPNSVTGNFIYDGQFTGQNDIIAPNAQQDFGNFMSSVGNYITNTPLPQIQLDPVISGSITFSPEIFYGNLIPDISLSQVLFDTGTTIIFDGLGLPDPHFFIVAPQPFIFSDNITIVLQNGAQPQNIYWISNEITFNVSTTPLIPGIFILFGSNITFNGPVNIHGIIICQNGSVTFTGPSSITGFSTGPPIIISDTCFPKSTPIQTDQGILEIQDLTSENTINNEPIIAITKTIIQDKFLICFDKHSISPDYPNQKTIMTRFHKIFYNKKMIEAEKFISFRENVYRVPYHGEVLYNVLMQHHRPIKVNGLVCETLDPNNHVAKLYNADMNQIEKEHLIVRLNNSTKKRDRKRAWKLGHVSL